MGMGCRNLKYDLLSNKNRNLIACYVVNYVSFTNRQFRCLCQALITIANDTSRKNSLLKIGWERERVNNIPLLNIPWFSKLFYVIGQRFLAIFFLSLKHCIGLYNITRIFEWRDHITKYTSKCSEGALMGICYLRRISLRMVLLHILNM